MKVVAQHFWFLVLWSLKENIAENLLLCLQETADCSEYPKDQQWLAHVNHILQQKVSLTYLQ